MNNYLTPSQSTTTNSIYNNLIGISNYDPFATSALASTLNKNYGLEQSRTNFDDDLRHRITDTDSMSSTPEQDRDRQIDAELYPELSNKYYSGLDYNDQNIISQGSSENELHDGLYREPQTPEVKKRFADDHMSSSPYQPLGDLSNDKPPRDSASTQESSPNRSNDEDDEGVESSLKNHSVSSGLPNLGNTCYMNSVLQCLFNTEKLSSLLEKNRQYIEKSESAPITNTFMEALAQAFTQNSSTRNMSTSLKTFKRALEKVAPIFKGYSQNDAHELFRSLTEKMHDEINHAPKKSGSYVEFTPSDQKNIHQIAEEWKNYSKDRDDSLFTSLFGGILLTEVKCNHCGHVSYTFEDAVDLSLNIANLKVEDSGYVTKLNTCLKDFAEPEFVDGYACDGCKRRDSSYKRTTVWKQPETLVVQLKRFVYDMYGELSAVKDSVAFPLDDLTLDEITHEESNERKERYKLYGIVNHMGSLNFGHYIAFVYNEEQGCWYQYNDDSVTKIDEDDMIEYARGSSEPYILFYKRV